MRHRATSLSVLAFALGFGLTACAQPAPSTPAQVSPDLPAGAEAAVKAALVKALPEHAVRRLRPAPFAGFTEAVVAGRVFYVSNDGRYIVDGVVVDLQERRNLADSALEGIRVEGLKSIPANQRIVFSAPQPKYTVTVFTDIDCGYCRMLHQHIDEYNALGISVEYLFFPRAGENSESWAKAEAVWCAADPRKAMTEAKAGRELDSPACDSPVAAEYALGREVGVNATPAVIAPSGALLGGYLEPQRLLEALQRDAERNAAGSVAASR